jgi:hypothetical protein
LKTQFQDKPEMVEEEKPQAEEGPENKEVDKERTAITNSKTDKLNIGNQTVESEKPGDKGKTNVAADPTIENEKAKEKEIEKSDHTDSGAGHPDAGSYDETPDFPGIFAFLLKLHIFKSQFFNKVC